MKKVLITGITGFVGKHLADHLLSQKKYEIIGTYRSDSGLETLGKLKDRLQLKQVDLNDPQTVESFILSEKPDYIYHLAAQASPSKSLSHPMETLTNNIASELSLLEALRKHTLPTRVLIVSTGDVYGIVKPADIPIDEETPMRPANPYAVSKITQDYLALQYHLRLKLML